MISQNEIQALYMNLYKYIRKYLWPFEIVVHIADLEIECYKAFPTIEELKRCLSILSSDVRSVAREDEDLSQAVEEFSSALDSATSIYNKLKSFKEVSV